MSGIFGIIFKFIVESDIFSNSYLKLQLYKLHIQICNYLFQKKVPKFFLEINQ